VTARVLTVGLLTAYLRELFESDELLADTWIEGEVSDLFRSRAGHVYFTLTDGESQLKCVLFRREASRQQLTIRAGDRISVHGRVSIYGQAGQYQLYADVLQPAGTGILALQFELLRQRLEAEGLFDPHRKRPIPASPRCIGVVTSPDGAVWHDIQHVLRRRYPLVELILAPATVQGDQAPESLVAALDALQEAGRADVIIVARGGGSAEDLWCFNDERVVRAVFASRIPVVSGIGHETDWTLVDYVADLRAPTPSAAAEICSPSIIDFADRVERARARLAFYAAESLAERREELRHRCRLLERRAPRSATAERRRSIVAMTQAMDAVIHLAIASNRDRVRSVARAATVQQRSAFGQRVTGVRIRHVELRSMDPRAVLNRGYAVVTRRSDGALVTSVGLAQTKDSIETRLRDGTIVSQVVDVCRRPIREEREGA
jgi:exodeoxyribonuclease VII large subunit